MNDRRERGYGCGSALTAVAAGALWLALADRACAGCGGFDPAANASSATEAPPGLRRFTRVSQVVDEPDLAADARRGGDTDRDGSPIVGMWNVTFTSDGTAYPQPVPLGVVFDFATIQYHSDGTEFQISGARPPSTGDVCMGVWKRVGDRTYKVKHLALAWVGPDSTSPAAGARYLGPAKFAETIQLNRQGDRFTGTMTLDQYADDGVTLLEHIAGTMTGVRFGVD